jgi:hypothetical protein
MGATNGGQGSSMIPLKEVENNGNQLDSMPTNFGRKTFYQSVNGTINQHIHQQQQIINQQQTQHQHQQFSSLENDISQ